MHKWSNKGRKAMSANTIEALKGYDRDLHRYLK
jgi:hypothetical protein